MLISLVGATSSLGVFDPSPAILAFVVLLFAIAVFAVIILLDEYRGARRRRSRISEQQQKRETVQTGENQGALWIKLPPGVGPVLPDEKLQPAYGSERGQPWQPSLSQEKSLQVAARRAGIDIRVLRSWAEQQRFKAADEDSK